MNPIDTIIFDYGGVVADHYVEPYQSKLGELLGGKTQKETRELTSERTPHGRDYRLGKISKEDFWNAIKQLVGVNFDIEYAQELFVKSYMLNPAMISLMKYLKEDKGIQIGLGVNEDFDRWKLVKESLQEISSVNIASCEVGFIKPTREFYKAILKAASRENEPSRVLYVDDRPTHVEGAKTCGLQGYQFINEGDFATAMTKVNLVPFK